MSTPRPRVPYDADDPLARALDVDRRATARPAFRQSLRRQLMTAPPAGGQPRAWLPRLALGPAAVVAFLVLAGTVLAASMAWRLTHPPVPPAPPATVATAASTQVVAAPLVQASPLPSVTATTAPTQPAATTTSLAPRRRWTATATATLTPTLTATLVPATEPEPEEPDDKGPTLPLATPTEEPVTARPTFPPEPTDTPGPYPGP